MVSCKKPLENISTNRRLNAITIAILTGTMLTSQPLSAATIKQNVFFETLGQSMWGTGSSTQISEEFFIGAEWDTGDKKFLEIGSAKDGSNGVRVDGSTKGRIGLETGWTLDSGTVNTALPFEFILDIPDASQLEVNELFSMAVTDATLETGAFLETIAPTIQAFANIVLEAEASVKAKGCYDVLIGGDCGTTKSTKLIDIDRSIELLSINQDADGEIRVLDDLSTLFAVGETVQKIKDVGKVEGKNSGNNSGNDDKDNKDNNKDVNEKVETYNFELKPTVSFGSGPLVELEMNLPNIQEEETLGSSLTVLQNGLFHIGDDTDILNTSGADEFLQVNVDLDQLFTNAAGLPPLGVEAELDFGIGSASASGDLLDVTLSPALEISQDFKLNITDMSVNYEFDSAVIGGTTKNNLSSRTSFENLDLNKKIYVEWEDKDIFVTPTYDIDLSLSNNTGLTINSSLEIDLLKGSVSAEVFGIDLGSKDFGPLIELPFDGPSFDLPPLFDNDFSLAGLESQTGNTFLLTTAEFSWKEGESANWNDPSKWANNIGSAPVGNDVVIRSNGSTDKSLVAITDEAIAGNVSIFEHSEVEIFEGGELNVKGDRLHNDGLLQVKQGELVFHEDSKVTGNGKIILESFSGSSTITSEADAVTTKTVNVNGQDIIVKSGEGVIDNVDLNLRQDSTLSVEDGTLELRKTTIAGFDNHQRAITGANGTTLELYLAEIRDIDLNATVAVNDDYRTICLAAGGCFTADDPVESQNINFWRITNQGDDIARNDGSILIVNENDDIDRKTLYLTGQDNQTHEFENNGTILVKGENGQLAELAFRSNGNREFVLSGDGVLRLEGDNAHLNSFKARDSLTNGEDHTIAGSGNIRDFKEFTNNGIISADQTAEILSIENLTSTNNGRIEAINRGRVEIDGTTLTNLSLGTGTVTLTGGEWAADNGTIQILGSNTKNTFVNKADISLTGNNAKIQVNRKFLDNYLAFRNNATGSVTLGSGAVFSMANKTQTIPGVGSFPRPDGVFYNSGLVAMQGGFLRGLRNEEGGLVEGFGTVLGTSTCPSGDCVEGEFVNKGTVRAVDGKLTLIGTGTGFNSLVNTGRIEAMNGATLEASTGQFNLIRNDSVSTFGNGGGTWAAYGDSEVAEIIIRTGVDGIQQIEDVNIVLSGENANFIGKPSLDGGPIKLQDSLVTISADASLQLENGQDFRLRNQVTNNGEVVLVDGTLQRAPAGPTTYLTNNGTIRGHGTLGQGVNPTIVNAGDITVEGGKLNLFGKIDNTNGTVTVKGEYGNVLDGQYIINDGAVTLEDQAYLTGRATLTDVTLTNRGTIDVLGGVIIEIDTAGASDDVPTSINSGVIQARDGSDLYLKNSAIDNLSGVIRSDNSRINLSDFTVLNGAIEVIGKSAALRGYGRMENVELKVSDGLISANVNGQRLTIDPSSAANLIRATLEARSGGILVLNNGEFNASGATFIRAKDGSIVELENIVMNGGQMVTEGTGKIIDLGSSDFTDMTFDAVTEVASGGEFNLYGIINSLQSLTAREGGSLHLHGANLVATIANVDVDGNITFEDAEGLVRIDNGGLMQLDGATVNNQRIENYGQITVGGDAQSRIDAVGDTLTNNGSLLVESNAELVVEDPAFVNAGEVELETDSQFTVQGTYTQTAGTTKVNGTLTADSLMFEEGILSGNGTIDGDTVIGENASINPGNSPGTLIFMDDLDLFGTYVVEVESSTVFDLIKVMGDVTFGASTLFDFRLDDGFDPLDLFKLEFLNADNFFNTNLLSKNNISVNGLLDGFDFDLNFEDFNNGGSLLSLVFFDTRNGNPGTSVSEPTMLSLMMLGLVLLARRRMNKA